ncbi:MAG TPA: iron-containing alcohol dehydrogenase [Magnetospirillaceae bacterium]|nr:iron-containing alcohol dehydrogenase [Magnetospirillaceae bacterium]
MTGFTFAYSTKILFGRGREKEVGKETSAHSRRILLHYGQGSIKKSGLYDRVCQSLRKAGVQFCELGGVVPNPRLSLVRRGIKLCRDENLDFVLAVGGGSVIDSAKAISIGVPYSGDVWDFFSGKSQIKSALPVGVVLTIPAAGSESSDGMVITNEEGQYKWDVGDPIVRPRFAILDPLLTLNLPARDTANGVADMLAHILERYFTRESGVDLTDRLCEAAMQGIIRTASLLPGDPANYDYRAQIMWGGTIAHNDFLGLGRVGDWGSHLMEHELSAIYDVAHGAGLAVIFPAWMRYLYRKKVQRFAQFAVRVFGLPMDFEHPEATALAGIRSLESFFRHLGLPVTLPELGVPTDRLEEMARKCTERGPIGNFARLDEKEVLAIYRLAAETDGRG